MGGEGEEGVCVCKRSDICRWLLVPGESGFHLEGEPDPPTFYQTLGEKYGGVSTIGMYTVHVHVYVYLYVHVQVHCSRFTMFPNYI